MMTRRSVLESAGLLLMFNQAVIAQTAAPRSQSVFQHDLPDLTLDGWSVTAVEVSYGPGQGSPPHRHPGITIAYVLEGEVRCKVGDDPERTYAAGEMFLETPQQLHAVSANASDTKPAKLLALLLAKKGVPLTTPAKD
ncbi:MAG TPA: cupin domain-containing protein [Vicinamibacterales bacterium]|jgi:quercetin dioxygenase-like cupin family protein|nr:cupin domain-containing protein [Vicinamibacterales bacterium]